LFTLEHFARFAGHKAKLKLVTPIDGQRKFKGTLQGVEDEQVIVNIGENELVLALSAIDKANLIPEF
jgi:ribosome maturation factor RimP